MPRKSWLESAGGISSLPMTPRLTVTPTRETIMNSADLFAQEADTINLSPGAVLFRQGDAGNEMFVLTQGVMDILVGEIVVETALRGALIGEMALIEETPRTATVIAKTACRLARIDERRFHQLIQQNPEFASHVMKVLVDRLREMNRRLTRP